MTRTNVWLIVVATTLGVVLIGGWVVWLVLPGQSSTPSAQTTASTTPEAATSSAALPPPAPVPTYAEAGDTTQTNPSIASAPASAAKTAATPAPATATLVVDAARFPLHAATGSTLEAAMAQLQSEGGFSYTTKSYGALGSFVTEINGRAGSGSYWIFYVNGAQSQTGISSTRIRSGDLIEWKLEKSY